MKTTHLLALLFTLGCLLPSFAEEAYTAKFYPVQPELMAGLMILPAGGALGGDPFSGGNDPFGGGDDPFGGVAAGAVASAEMIALVTELAALPERSEVKYLAQLGKLFVRTSDDGHRRFNEIMKELNVPPQMVEIDFTLIGLSSNDVVQSEVFKKTGSLDSAEVMRLFHAGRGKLECLNKVVTLSGVNAQVEAVHEIIYPTEFEVERTKNPEPITTPGAFETRETGTILNVTPTIAPGAKTINLAIIPEKAELTGWINYNQGGAEESDDPATEDLHAASQPVFRSFNVTTSLVVLPGVPVVVGGGPHPTSGKQMYAIVTARLIDVVAEDERSE